MNFIMSAVSDVGIKKNVNQDSFFIYGFRTEIGNIAFAVLCDGMGGLQHGEIASRVITTAFTQWATDVLPILKPYEYKDQLIRQQWTDLIYLKNKELHSLGKSDGCRIGSTVTAILLTEKRYFILNIGDTRAYKIDKAVVQLTSDHTVIAEEVALGNMTWEQAKSSPMRNVLTRCVGVTEDIYPDMFFGETERNSIYMLCTDGFRHYITHEEMRSHLTAGAKTAAEGLEAVERALIEINKQRGETDNISVISIYAQ